MGLTFRDFLWKSNPLERYICMSYYVSTPLKIHPHLSWLSSLWSTWQHKNTLIEDYLSSLLLANSKTTNTEIPRREGNFHVSITPNYHLSQSPKWLTESFFPKITISVNVMLHLGIMRKCQTALLVQTTLYGL